MKTNTQFGPYLAQLFLESEIFQTKVIEIIKTHFTFNKACEQDQDVHPDPARKLSANLYDIYHCCVCTVKNS